MQTNATGEIALAARRCRRTPILELGAHGVADALHGSAEHLLDLGARLVLGASAFVLVLLAFEQLVLVVVPQALGEEVAACLTNDVDHVLEVEAVLSSRLAVGGVADSDFGESLKRHT